MTSPPVRVPAHLVNLGAARACALTASSARFLGGALVSSELRRLPEIAAISSTAARNAASLAFDGLLKPLTFLTNCNEAARIFSSVTGGWKLKSVLMFLHTIIYLDVSEPLNYEGVLKHDHDNHYLAKARSLGLDWRTGCGRGILFLQAIERLGVALQNLLGLGVADPALVGPAADFIQRAQVGRDIGVA